MKHIKCTGTTDTTSCLFSLAVEFELTSNAFILMCQFGFFQDSIYWIDEQFFLKSLFIIIILLTHHVAKELEQVGHLPEGLWFDPGLLHSTCQSVHGQDTEPSIFPDGCTGRVWMVCDRKDAALQQLFMNGCDCVWMCVNEWMMLLPIGGRRPRSEQLVSKVWKWKVQLNKLWLNLH